MAREWIEIDGSQGEGGGQILRSSLALSILMQRPVRLVKIRARRSKPGLQAQHLTAVRAAAAVSGAQMQGDSPGSQTLSFQPGQVQSGDYFFPIGTAGSTALVLQTVALPLLLRGQEASSVRIKGGTHALAAPSGEFLAQTWQGYQCQLGMEVDVEVHRRGFFPRGGGMVWARLTVAQAVRPVQLTEPLAHESGDWEFQALVGGSLPESIAQRMVRRARDLLGSSGSSVIMQDRRSSCDGVVATVIDRRGGVPTVFFALGARGKPAERVAEEAVESYQSHLKTAAAVDPHSADQLVLPLALAAGPSAWATSAVTEHLMTNLAIARRFVERRMECEGKPGGPGIVRID